MPENSFENFPEKENNKDRDLAESKERIPILIWIIDDNKEFARALSSALREFRVEVFLDGESAIAAASAIHSDGSTPTAILVDGNLGEGKLTGPEIVKALCGLGIGTETKTTFITLSSDRGANSAMETEARANGAPVVVYKKGGDLRELKEILRSA
jgi:CheY-like chemotaxis protein